MVKCLSTWEKLHTGDMIRLLVSCPRKQRKGIEPRGTQGTPGKGIVTEYLMELKHCDEHLIDKVLTAATAVHSNLGPGLLESVYEQALMIELDTMGVPARNQVEIPATYRGHDLGLGFRADIIVADSLLLEIKSVRELDDTHLAQILTYLKLLRFKRGYLLNFNVRLLKEGIRRVSI